MNSAVALGKLGPTPTSSAGCRRTRSAAQLRQHILGANVQLDLATESSQATSIAVVSLDDEGVASYTFHFADTANFGWQVDDLPELADDDWLHIASLSCVVSPGAEVLLDWMRTVTAGVSYDINVRPTVITDPDEYWAKVQPWLRVRRAAAAASSRPATRTSSSWPRPPGRRLRRVRSGRGGRGLGRRSTGSSLAVVTLGPGGGVAVEPGGNATRVPGFPTKVVDTVGAGDTFMAGFLDGSGQPGARTWRLPAAGGRRRVDRLLAPGRPAADHGRGGRPDRRRRLKADRIPRQPLSGPRNDAGCSRRRAWTAASLRASSGVEPSASVT